MGEEDQGTHPVLRSVERLAGRSVRYEHDVHYWQRGQKTPPMDASKDAVTVGYLVNKFLEHREGLVESGELARQTWLDYKRIGEELRTLFVAANPQMRCFILLGLNGGLGNADIGKLEHRHVVDGWIDFPRPKTLVDRRFPLWPETAIAIEATKQTKRPDLPYVFLTKYGQRWFKDSGDDPLSKEFRKLAKECDCHKVGRGFYALRHVFRSVARGCRNREAVDYVMGHPDESTAAHYMEWGVEDERLQAVVDHVREWAKPMLEVMGILALMLLHESRRQARTSEEGELVLLDEQDRTLWNQELIAEGKSLVKRSFVTRRFGLYTIQAAISAVHSDSASADQTDWRQIVALYDLLLRVDASPVVELNRAVAVAMRDGPSAGLAIIDAILARGELEKYHLAHAARADLLRRLGKRYDSRAAYERALALTPQEPERRFLMRRLSEMAEHVEQVDPPAVS